LSRLETNTRYPPQAKARGDQGVVFLRFVVDRSGRIIDERLRFGSGSPALDAEALALVRRAEPLPAFPPELPYAELEFSILVRFAQ
jgi:protein TonB